MTLKPIAPCCKCPEHQRPHVNEDGWVLTGLIEDSSTWEAWTDEEWAMHGAHFMSRSRSDRLKRERDGARRRYHEKKGRAA